MDTINAIILGIIQGLTEFLPVSSSGHLEIFKVILGENKLANESLLMTVILHFATACSTIVIFRNEIKKIITDLISFKKNESFWFSLKIVISMVPAAFVGFFLEKEVESLFTGNLLIVGGMLIITGLLLLLADKAKPTEKNINLKLQVSKYINNENILLENTKNFEKEISSLKNNSEVLSLRDNEKMLIDMNKDLKDEIISLKSKENDLLKNNRKLSDELNEITSQNSIIVEENQLKNLKQKLNFHQDENLRLSHELSNSQKKYKLIKNQLEGIEREKSDISKKIDDLSVSLNKTQVVTNIFDDPNNLDIEKKSKNKSSSNIENEIKKIFSK